MKKENATIQTQTTEKAGTILTIAEEPTKLIYGNAIIELKDGKIFINNKDMDIVFNNETIYSVYPSNIHPYLKTFLSTHVKEFLNYFKEFDSTDYVVAKGEYEELPFEIMIPNNPDISLFMMKFAPVVNPMEFEEAYDLKAYFEDHPSELEQYENKIAQLWKQVDDTCVKHQYQYDFQTYYYLLSNPCKQLLRLYFNGREKSNWTENSFKEVIMALKTYISETNQIIDEIEEKINNYKNN